MIGVIRPPRHSVLICQEYDRGHRFDRHQYVHLDSGWTRHPTPTAKIRGNRSGWQLDTQFLEGSLSQVLRKTRRESFVRRIAPIARVHVVGSRPLSTT